MKKSVFLKLGLILTVIAVDLITKLLLFDKDLTLIPFFVSSRSMHGQLNTGAAWGIMGDNTIFLIFFTIVFLVVFAFIDFKWKIQNKLYSVAISFIIGGALGNMIDRIFLGGVRDFLFFEFYPDFPTFNMADSFLCVGMLLLIIYIFFFASKDFNKQSNLISKNDTKQQNNNEN